MATLPSNSATIRAKLKHPIIDSDGHLIEVLPVLFDYVRQEGGESAVKALQDHTERRHWTKLSFEERRDARITATTWWLVPTKNGLDRATAMIPRLLNERLDDLGLDFCVLYPSTALAFPSLGNDELRSICCRAYNRYVADSYGPYSYRMTPAALIPMHTPEEAINEIEYATKKLGLKVAAIAGHVRRPIGKLRREFPGITSQYSTWTDTFGDDSDHNYDPFWAKAVELGMPLATHSAGFGFTTNSNISNFMQNHLGHFSLAGYVLCKSLFFSGVTRRFPDLRIAFLEGGVGWATDLYAGILARWEKRNPKALSGLDPRELDTDHVMDLFASYGDPATLGKLEEIKGSLSSPSMFAAQNAPQNLNDFERAGVTKPEDVRERFIPNFFFGCEADDPMNATAFDSRVVPLGSKIGAMLSSDIGHWDVVDMRDVVEEAHEMVEHGLITEENFRDFTFTNPVRFFTDLNPGFFEGTSVEAAVKEVQ